MGRGRWVQEGPAGKLFSWPRNESSKDDTEAMGVRNECGRLLAGQGESFGSKDFSFQPPPLILPLTESWSWVEGEGRKFRFRRAAFDGRPFADLEISLLGRKEARIVVVYLSIYHPFLLWMFRFPRGRKKRFLTQSLFSVLLGCVSVHPAPPHIQACWDAGAGAGSRVSPGVLLTPQGTGALWLRTNALRLSN